MTSAKAIGRTARSAWTILARGWVAASALSVVSAVSVVSVVAPVYTVRAQSARLVTVHGIAWDSLRSAPLEGAFITIGGTDRSATSDARGYFRFDSVAPGRYVFAMDHAALDAIGFAGVTRKVVVTDGRDTVRTAVPSFAAFWHLACDNRKVPADSGIVYGTVRTENGAQSPARARVSASWVDVGYDKAAGVTQRRFHFEAGADTSGTFALCGVPTNTALHLAAAIDSTVTGFAELPASAARVQRRDLLVGAALARGIITGIVTDAAGAPYADARVSTEGVPEARSGTDGAFTLRDVPTGTRQVDVVALGMLPQSVTVDVGVRDTARALVTLSKMTSLGAVKVVTTPVQLQLLKDIEERKLMGFGHFVDSSIVSKYATLATALSAVPGMRQGRGCVVVCMVSPPTSLNAKSSGICQPFVWIDKEWSSVDDLRMLGPDGIGSIEIYRTLAQTPMQFQPVSRSNRGDPCGTLVVWTKRFLP